MHVCMYISIYMYDFHVCIHMYMYIYIYMYLHTLYIYISLWLLQSLYSHFDGFVRITSGDVSILLKAGASEPSAINLFGDSFHLWYYWGWCIIGFTTLYIYISNINTIYIYLYLCLGIRDVYIYMFSTGPKQLQYLPKWSKIDSC